MKQGANRSDINKIAKLYAEGNTAKEISVQMQIALQVIKNFAPVKSEVKKVPAAPVAPKPIVKPSVK